VENALNKVSSNSNIKKKKNSKIVKQYIHTHDETCFTAIERQIILRDASH
jgi:hypothetical protein